MTTEKFHWTTPNGDEIVLPYMGKIKAGIVRRHRKEEPVDFIFSVLEDLNDDATLAKVDDLEQDSLNDLIEKWQNASVSLGESSRSST